MTEIEIQLKRYQTLMKNTLDGIYIIDTQGDIVEVNDAFCNMLGYSQEEAKKLNLVDFDSQLTKKELLKKFNNFTGVSARFETKHRRKNGKLVDVEISATGADIDGQLYIFASIRDITERNILEAKVQRHTQLYAALSECNKAILHCANEKDLFLQICRAAVQFGGMKMAWVGLIDTETRILQPVASFGDDTGYLKDLNILMDTDGPFECDPTDTTARENRLYWYQDYMGEPTTVPWQQHATHADLATSVSLRLHRNGIVIGSFTLFSGKTNSFDEAMRNLLIEMAENISFALDIFAHNSQRKLVQAEINLKNIILETQQETSLDALLIVDENQQITSYNQQFITMWGLSPQLFGRDAHEYVIQSIAGQAMNMEEHLAHVRHMFKSQ